MFREIKDSYHKLWVKIFLGFIIFIFVISGFFGIQFSALRTNPMTVDGTDISLARVSIKREQLLETIRAQYGADFQIDETTNQQITSQLIQTLLVSQLLANESNQFSMPVDLSLLHQDVKSNPAFASADSSFSMNTFKTYLNSINISMKEFYQSTEVDRQAELVSGLLQNIVVPATELLKLHVSELLEERSGSYLVVDPAALEADVQVSQEEIETYFSQNSTSFVEEQAKKISYSILSPSDFAVEKSSISQEQIDAAYATYQQNFAKTDTSRVRLAQILLPEENKQQVLETIQNELLAGRDFGELAQELSQDDFTKEAGGDMGELEKSTLPQEIQDAIEGFEVGDYTKTSVDTEFGSLVLKVLPLGSTQVALQSKAEIRDTLLVQIAEDLRSEALAAFLENYSQNFQNFNSLKEAVPEAQEILESDWILWSADLETRQRALSQADLPILLSQNEEAQGVITSEEFFAEGKLAQVVKLDENNWLLIAPGLERPRRLMQLEEVQDQISARLKSQKAESELQSGLNKLVSLTNLATPQTNTFDSLVAGINQEFPALGLSVKSFTNLSLYANNQTSQADLAQKIDLQDVYLAGTFFGVNGNNSAIHLERSYLGDFVVFMVDAVQKGSLERADKNALEDIGENIYNGLSSAFISSFIGHKLETADVEYN